MVHGAVENGRIFYSNSGKGLAPYLQAKGLDVYVLDLRGRGQSRPKIDRRAVHGQHESITVDLPAASAWIAQRRPDAPQFWISHSWGGVLQMSAMMRDPLLMRRVAGLVHFGVKRAIRVWSWKRFFQVELGWKRLAVWISAVVGYLPADRLGYGSDVETRASLRASNAWIGRGAWVDRRDGFDYFAAAQRQKQNLPPSLWLTGSADSLLGHREDVLRFMHECGVNESSFVCVGQAYGALRDYGHNDLLTHADAPQDHFPRVLAWILDQEGATNE